MTEELKNYDEEIIESNIEANSEILNQKILSDKEEVEKQQGDNDSESSLNSELTLDLYCYSDENN